jgi:CRISPR/Cas system CMR-associated protein Cmr5 small subunit
MFLREFIYFDRTQTEMVDDQRYNSNNDTSVLKSSDLRKTRLTLRMLNDLRKAGDARETEQKEELALVRKMYAAPAPEAAPV